MSLKYEKKSDARVYSLYENPLTGSEIEARSFACIDREMHNHAFTEQQWVIVRQMIHTCADFTIARHIRFSSEAIASGIAALKRGSKIYVDSSMIKAGISLKRLCTVYPRFNKGDISCHIADSDVATAAVESGLPRSLHAVRKARAILDGGIVLFGNAPVGLLELNRMIKEEGASPALVIGMPVGFVHVEESKEELCTIEVPSIILEGRRGGSTLAVSVLHGLCTIAGKCGLQPKESTQRYRSALVVLGHGSRVTEAAKAMEQVAAVLRQHYPERLVEIAQMSLCEPSLESIIAHCNHCGVTEVLVIPYFLHDGIHMKIDIPEIMKKCAALYPQMKMVLGKCLGYDDSIAELVLKRVEESATLEDIRTYDLPGLEALTQGYTEE